MANNKTPEEPEHSALNGSVTHGDMLLEKAVGELGTKTLDVGARPWRLN